MSSYLRFLAKALAIVVGVCVLAAWPVHALSGEQGVLAFLAGALVCLVGAAAGRLPHLFFKRGPDAIVHASLAGVGIRLLVTLALAVPLLLLDLVPQAPAAAGLVITYVVLLAVEVRELVRLGGTLSTSTELPSAPRSSEPKGAPTR